MDQRLDREEKLKDEFLEFKSIEGQPVFLRRSSVGAFEVVPATQRVEGHIKVYVEGHKFLIQASKEDFLKQLNG